MHFFPTRDLHLVQTTGLDGEVHLSLFEDRPDAAGATTWTDLASLPGIKIGATARQGVATATVRGRSSPPAANDSPRGLSLAPAQTGVGFYAVSVIDATPPARFFMLRVSVHADITRIWLAQTSITMLAGERNVVLTVFAEFPDPGGPTSWDVSEHPYLEFESAQPTIADIDRNGRVSAIAVGTATIHAWIAGRRATTQQSCTVVVDTVAARRQRGDIQIQTLHAPRGATQRYLILSEGFSDPDEFARQARQVVDKWLRGEANSPFRWVRDRLRVISIFDSTPQRGIAVGPVFGDVGTPGNPKIVPLTPPDISGVSGTMRYQPASDTRFGLMYGARLGDPQATESNPAVLAQHAGDEWMRPGGTYQGQIAQPVRVDRSITVDHRKLPPYRDGTQPPIVSTDPRAAFAGYLRRYLTGVGLPGGADEDRIIFLVDDQFRGGARLAVVGLEPADNRRVSMSTASDDGGFDGLVFPPDTPWIARTPIRRAFHAGWVASSVVHELGHTYGLGDEYEPRRDTITATAESRANLLGYDNLQLRDDVFELNGDIAIERIKWNVDRVRKASTVLLVSRAPTVPPFYDLSLDGDPQRLWKPNERAFLRTTYGRAPESPDPQVARHRVHGVIINNVSEHGVNVHHVSGPPIDTAAIAGQLVLYLPLTADSGASVTMIDAAVVAYLQTTNTVFPKPAPCATTEAQRPGLHEEEVRPPAIPNLKLPSRPADLVGLYEGGAEHACGVVRPTGRCKLRRAAVYDESSSKVKEIWPFCFVCKFILADRIDPGVHPRLDSEYPRDC